MAERIRLFKMTWRSRRVMAVVIVTTALCADQVGVAAPVARPQAATQIAGMAGRLVSRLAQHLRRVVPSAVRFPARSNCRDFALSPFRPKKSDPLLAARQPLSPFQFRLPPPLV